jgi:hypothetical protein
MTNNFPGYGRTWPDVLIALLTRWQGLMALLVAVSLLTSWAHHQTAPGDRVELFGVPLWRKGALPPSPSALAPAPAVADTAPPLDSAPVKPKPRVKKVAPQQDASTERVATAPSPTSARAAPSEPSRPSDSVPAEPEQAAPTIPSPKETPVESAPTTAARSSYAVALPSRREYVLGPKDVGGRYMLVSARVDPQTPESDALTIQVRVKSTALQGHHSIVNQGSFGLVVGRSSIAPEGIFADIIASGTSRDREIVFIIEPGVSRATLTITNFTERADIPLDLTPPGA